MVKFTKTTLFIYLKVNQKQVNYLVFFFPFWGVPLAFFLGVLFSSFSAFLLIGIDQIFAKDLILAMVKYSPKIEREGVAKILEKKNKKHTLFFLNLPNHFFLQKSDVIRARGNDMEISHKWDQSHHVRETETKVKTLER